MFALAPETRLAHGVEKPARQTRLKAEAIYAAPQGAALRVTGVERSWPAEANDPVLGNRMTRERMTRERIK
jgi:hypothetical protein